MERHIGDYHFIADPHCGFTARWGKSLDENPGFAPVPELADISISNYCTKGCSFCYKNSTPQGTIMSLESYKMVLDQLEHPVYGSVFQVALGGGEPLEHPQFREIIDETVHRGIVPNFTTNGLHMTQDIASFCKDRVGAVAVSTESISGIPQHCVKLLIENGIRTNIHFVLQNDNIIEAIQILLGKYDKILEGVNALIFLTFKPAGRGEKQHLVREGIEFLDFLKAVKHKTTLVKIGFDACFVPHLLHYDVVNSALVDTCEGGYFSVYIDEKCQVSPCSFSGNRDKYPLSEYPFYDIWLHKFEAFRARMVNKCTQNCQFKSECRGVCPYYPQITLCYHEH